MKTNQGFTLLELLMVVATVAVLASVSIPAYNDYIIRGKLAEGIATLADGRVRLEQYFQDNRTYVGGPAPATSSTFTYAVSGTSTTAYTITATGTGRALGFVYTIDQDNAKKTTAAPTGWATAGMPGTPASCWIAKKGGIC